MEPVIYKHYIVVDANNRIINGFSSAFKEPSENDICINEYGGYQFRLTPDGEENPVIFSDDGIPRYRLDGSAAVLRTEEELEADRAERPAPPPTTEEVLLELSADHEARLCEIELGV